MAEYVRRRRPPASHPYWARLHDRAHPPSVVAPVALPTVVGLGLGLWGGLERPFSMSEVVKVAAALAAGMGGLVFVASLPLLLHDASRQVPRQERWAASVIWATAASALVFLVGLVGMVPMLAWYSVCSGQGPWLGMFTGGLIGAVPGALCAAAARRRWRERQRRWPRWERMRTPRRRPTLTVTAIPAPLPPGEAAGRPENHPSVEPARPETEY